MGEGRGGDLEGVPTLAELVHAALICLNCSPHPLVHIPPVLHMQAFVILCSACWAGLRI